MSGKDSGKQNRAAANPGGVTGKKAEQQKNWKPKYNPWLIAVVVTMAAFMEILDTTIVNVSLPHIAGSLSSSYDDATWALTSYLVANGIVLTISGWLSDTFGRKRYFITCILMFTVFSFLCGISTNLGELVVFRLLQGFFGGGLQPSQQSIILDTFEPAQRGKAFGLTAIATIVAPVIAPTLGGWLTDTYSWRWVFFVNVPVGLATAAAVLAVLEDPPWAGKQKRKIDIIGLSLITIGLGCLQVMLDRGEDDDWFGSPFIRVLAVLATLGIIGAIGWLLVARRPVVNLYVFGDRNFALGALMVGVMGLLLYSSAVLIPQLAQQVLGYTATLAGLVLTPGGLVIILLIPLVGLLMSHVAVRYVIAFGFALMGCAMAYSSHLAPDVNYITLVKMRAFQTAALAFLFVPISTVAYATLPRSMNNDAAALFSMARNVCGSIGISLATALVTQRTQIEMAHMSRNMTPLSQGFVTTRQQYEAGLLSMGRVASTLESTATSSIYQAFRSQSSVLAYADIFTYCAIGAFAVAPLAFLLSKAKKGGGDAPPAH